MRNKAIFFAFTAIISLFATGLLHAQHSFFPKPYNPNPVAKKIQFSMHHKQDTVKINKPLFDFGKILVSRPNSRPIPVHPGHTYQHWGWFCRSEFKFQQTTRIPLYLRLGSVEQVNYLEGKRW